MNQQAKKIIEKMKEEPELKIEEIKKEIPHFGICSFSKVSREICSCLSKRKETSFKFEERRTGDVWEIEFKIKLVAAEIKTDPDGKTWRRIA